MAVADLRLWKINKVASDILAVRVKFIIPRTWEGFLYVMRGRPKLCFQSLLPQFLRLKPICPSTRQRIHPMSW